MTDRSIHPRVVGGRQVHDKVDTSKPHKGGGKLAKALANRTRRRSDMAATMARDPKNATAYTMPGSMKC